MQLWTSKDHNLLNSNNTIAYSLTMTRIPEPWRFDRKKKNNIKKNNDDDDYYYSQKNKPNTFHLLSILPHVTGGGYFTYCWPDPPFWTGFLHRNG